jgi:hypothetical protein
MPSTRSDELSHCLKTESFLQPIGNSFLCGPSLNDASAANRNGKYLFPYLSAELKQLYTHRTRHTVAHYLRAFRFPGEFVNSKDANTFNILSPDSLRLRFAYLYWVSIHTGKPDPDFTALFLGMYHFRGKYKVHPEEDDCE